MAIVKSEKLGIENQNTQPTQIYTLLLAIWYWFVRELNTET